MGNEIFWRLLWIATTLVLAAYAAYLFFGSIVEAETQETLTRVEVYDFIDREKKTHRLSGMIMVPTRCHEVRVKVGEEEGHPHLLFSTFGDVHGCAPELSPRSFVVVVSAPLVGSIFTASLDWQEVDFVIISRGYTSS